MQTPAVPIMAAAALLPDRAGLLLIYAAFGCFGGFIAGIHKSNDNGPSLWAIVQRATVGLGMGFLAGGIGLSKASESDTAFYLTAVSAFISGFFGPVYALALYRKVTQSDPSKPQGDPP